MPEQQLREHLRQLHAELATVEDLDDELAELLRQTAADIEQALGTESSAGESAQPRLEGLALKFEADHPRLARILGEITDTLAKLGI